MFNPIQFYEFGKKRGGAAFISTWKTDNVSTGSSANNQVKLPLISTGSYDFIVDWGDGTQDTITVWNQAQVTHTYTTIGTYVLSISGIITGFVFNNALDRLKLLNIQTFGILKFANRAAVFAGCNNLTLDTVSDVINLDGQTTLANFFQNCTNLVKINKSNEWSTSNIQSLSSTFNNCQKLTADIGLWNTGSVSNINTIFFQCFVFNTDISGWDMSSLTSANAAFNNARVFNQNIGLWNVSNLKDAGVMFFSAFAFNQNIGGWNVSSVNTMISMFNNTTSFNQNIGSWNVSGVTDMQNMFRDNPAFNQNIGSWNVSNVTNMTTMFRGKTPTTFSTTNLDAIYNGWSSRPVKTTIVISFGTAKYTTAASSGRAILTGSPNNWVITDGGI